MDRRGVTFLKKLTLKKIPPVIILGILCSIGFVTGVIVVFQNPQIMLQKKGLFTPDFFYRLKNITVDSRTLLLLSFWKRFQIFFLLWFLVTSSFARWCYGFYAFGTGFFIGRSLEVLILFYGLPGIGIYSLLVLPHGIFYFLSYSILLIQGMKKKKERQGTFLAERERREERKKIFMAMTLLAIGCFMEAYCNLFTLFYLK